MGMNEQNLAIDLSKCNELLLVVPNLGVAKLTSSVFTIQMGCQLHFHAECNFKVWCIFLTKLQIPVQMSSIMLEACEN